MKKIKISLIISIFFLFVGCSSNDDAEIEKTINDFFELYNAESSDGILLLTDKSVIEKGQTKEFFDIIKRKFEDFGKLKSFEKYNLIFKEKDNREIALAYYKCKYQLSDLDVFIEFSLNKIDKGYKILGFSFSYNKEFIDNRESYSEKSLKKVDEFYLLLDKNNLKEIKKMYDNELVIDEGLEGSMDKAIDYRMKHYGKMKSYAITNDEILSSTDSIPIAVIKTQSTNENEILFEKIVLVKRKSDFKIIQYSFGKEPQE